MSQGIINNIEGHKREAHRLLDLAINAFENIEELASHIADEETASSASTLADDAYKVVSTFRDMEEAGVI